METKEIKEICKKFKIEDYQINDDETIDVNNDVFIRGITGEKIEEITLLFNKIIGDFVCNFNKIKSIKGSRTIV